MANNYASMKKAELVALCEERKLAKNGNMQTLIARLEDFDQKVREAENSGIGVGGNSKKTYAINAMRPALIWANGENNRKAISKKDALEQGVDEERFDQWVMWCKELYEVVANYVTLKRDRVSDEEARNRARGKIYPIWRKIVKVGEETAVSKNMYIREDDVESLIGFCEDFARTAMGTEQACATETNFRKLVETLIGCRIKGCTTLPKKDRELLSVYEGALKSKTRNEEALNGTKDKKGIIADLQGQEVALEKVREKLRSLGATEEAIAELTSAMVENVKALKTAKRNAEKAVKDAESTIKKNESAAKVIYDRIGSREI